MNRFIMPALLFVAMAVIGHFAVLHAIPRIIMGTAMERMAAGGIAAHEFMLTPRTTPQTQTVVRPSPDLAYSVCRFELTGEDALRVTAGPYDNYASISFFDARTINFATVRVGAGDSVADASDVVLLAPGRDEIDTASFRGLQVQAPTRRGLILIRRLAPSQTDYDRVVSTASADSCAKFES